MSVSIGGGYVTSHVGDPYRLPNHTCATCGLSTRESARPRDGGPRHEYCRRDPFGRLFVREPNLGEGCLVTVAEWARVLALVREQQRPAELGGPLAATVPHAQNEEQD